MSTVPSFVRSFQQSFNRTMADFAVAQRKRALAVDRRLRIPIDAVLATLTTGKRLRPLLVRLGFEAVNHGNAGVVAPAGLAVELFHSFALIHDDIIDRAASRRGVPTVHHTIARSTGSDHAGLTAAILGGDLLLAATDQFDEISVPANRRGLARKAFQSMAEETILGQQLEFDLSRSKRVSLEDIIRTMILKSGRYSIEWPLTIGALLGGASSSLVRSLSSFSVPLGIAFQLRDDILGTFGNEKDMGKPNDSDIKEGKYTLLVHFTFEGASPNERAFLNRILGNRRASSRDITQVRTLMRLSGALSMAEKLDRDLTDAGLAALSQSRVFPRAKNKISSLARYLLNRTN